ncbi:MAG: hypothetical protein Q9191_006429 [Dirinaria sp. TL-2023a]
MPITLRTGDVAASAWKTKTTRSDRDLLAGSSPQESKLSKRIIQSSFSKPFLASNSISASKNGLVYALYTAWSGHHHLTLRPEDIWFAILSQLSFYINAHAEELRSYFVAHEDQKELETIDYGTIDTVDFGPIAVKMTRLIEQNVRDPELRTWIMPDFSTTTHSDRVVASILMMGTLQKYFTYKMTLCCGIPSVTLLGEKADWQTLLHKLHKIPELGTEPAVFAKLLKPVLERFVRSFDAPTDPDILNFWNRAVHESGGSGPVYLSGWATAFCFWDEEGKSLYRIPQTEASWTPFGGGNDVGFELDGVRFHHVDTDDIPSGSASVPVTVDDNGKLYSTKMLAGSVGIQGSCSSSSAQMPHEEAPPSYEALFRMGSGGGQYGRMVPQPLYPATRAREVAGIPGLDSLQPVTGWWMYEVKEA